MKSNWSKLKKKVLSSSSEKNTSMDRFFQQGDYVYDRDDSSRRAPFTRGKSYPEVVEQMNKNGTVWAYEWAWDIGRDKNTEDPWPDPSEFVDEYAEAVKVLGEDYFA